ncbi:MAG TPA: hypothetical protein EYH01_02295 [Campylobacterales bacterium]|nr:hypothetical protein [Campylobacterales bacterium]
MRVATLVFILFLFASCGYKPTSLYTKEVLGDKIYAEVAISLEDPENSVLIKDALNEAIVSQFRSRIVSLEKADSKFYINLNSVSFVPIQYDKNGYVIAYKTHVGLKTKYIDKEYKTHVITTKGDYDFPIESTSLISDTKRFAAIKFASQKALDAVRSQIAIRSIK